jgi:hypothetical protein
MSQTESASYVPNNRGGYAVCIGNGQLHDALSPAYEVSKTLNCMIDPMKVMVVAEAWDGSDVSPTLTARNCGGVNGCQTKEISQQ